MLQPPDRLIRDRVELFRTEEWHQMMCHLRTERLFEELCVLAKKRAIIAGLQRCPERVPYGRHALNGADRYIGDPREAPHEHSNPCSRSLPSGGIRHARVGAGVRSGT